MAALRVPLHGGDGIAHQAKGHQLIGCALVLDQNMDIARTAGGFQRIKDIAVVRPEIVFKKAAGFQTQGVQFADLC